MGNGAMPLLLGICKPYYNQVIKQDEMHRKSVRIPILLLANDLRASRIRVRSRSAASEPGFDPGQSTSIFLYKLLRSIRNGPFRNKRTWPKTGKGDFDKVVRLFLYIHILDEYPCIATGAT